MKLLSIKYKAWNVSNENWFLKINIILDIFVTVKFFIVLIEIKPHFPHSEYNVNNTIKNASLLISQK
jgi:hypothetical protein